MKDKLTLGSLFDGSGGFPLGGVINGIEPIWASEIEPYPLRVTSARFPNMKQYGDVTKINGAEVEPVDIITFGSPCQDLSISGLRKGIIEGSRSNLFFEAIRIIKEMREHDKELGRTGIDVRPRFAVFENVCGALSSCGGGDFREVLQSFFDINGCDITIPRPPHGKWLDSGAVVDRETGTSLCWRVYDLQFWGCPQRRRRVYLVCDFGSANAGELLFEQIPPVKDGLLGDIEQSIKAWKDFTNNAERST